MNREPEDKKLLDQQDTETSLKGLRSRAVINISYTKLKDRPGLLEDKLLQDPGIMAAEINVFSNRIRIEFDPSKTTIDKIRKTISIIVDS